MQQSFDVIDATLKETYGGHVSIWDRIEDKPMEPLKAPEIETLIMLRVKAYDWSSGVTLSTGEHLKDIEGSVEIRPQTEELRFQEGGMGIGLMTYLSESSRYFILVRIPQAQFYDLVAAARVGRVPSRVEIEDRSRMDIDGKIWDIESERNIHVSLIEFSIPLAPMQSQMFQFLHDFVNDSKQWGDLLQGINKKLKWLAVMISVLGVALLLLQR
jgi:hypothetical protein